MEATWRAVVGQQQMTEKTLSNAILSHLSTATWRVFGKSIYKRKQLKVKSYKLKVKKQITTMSYKKINIHMTLLSSLTEMLFICI